MTLFFLLFWETAYDARVRIARRRALGGLLTTIGATLLLLAPSASAGTDAWTQWVPLKDSWIRSLDFTTATTLVASSDGDGVFQSTATAGPWTQTNDGLTTPGELSVYQVVAAYGNLYAATSSGLFMAPQGGGSWTQLGDGPGNNTLDMGGIESVVVQSPSAIVVAVAGAADPGVYTSSDGGGTWNRAAGMPIGENVFDLAAGTASIIYAAGDGGIWTSLDGGASWTLTSDGINPGETPLRVAVTPGTPNELWATASDDVYESDDAGLTWTNVDGSGATALPGGVKYALLPTPAVSGYFGAGRILIGTPDGVWASIDGGADWGQMSPDATGLGGAGVFGNRIVWALGIGFGPPALLAGTQGFGVYSLPLSFIIKPSSLTISPSSGLEPGDTLTVSGTWGGTAPFFYTYQWKKCHSGGSCTNITSTDPSTPGGTGPSYTIPSDDGNSPDTYYEVQVCASNLVSPVPVCDTSSATGAGVSGLPGEAPVPWHGINDSSLSPDPDQSYAWGTTFTIDPGDWGTEQDPGGQITPLDYAYQWQRCDSGGDCTVIAGATADSYTTTVADVGDSIVGYVQANAGLFPSYSSDFYEVAATFTIIEKTPVNTAAPEIIGTPYVGDALQSTAGAWSGHDPTYEREWLECDASGEDCNPMNPDQTGDAYTLTSADLGSTLELQVTADQSDPSDPLGRETVATSAPTAVITDPPAPAGGGSNPSPPPGPTPPGSVPPAGPQPSSSWKPSPKPVIKLLIPRKLIAGVTLKGPLTEPGFVRVSYQWLRNGKPIRGATRRTYKLTRSDTGKRITLRMTLRTSAGVAVVVTSNVIRVPTAPRARHRRP